MRPYFDYSKVPEEYRLSFVVGEIARNDVYAENELKVLRQKLANAGLPSALFLREFGKAIPQVRSMLMQPQVPEPFAKIAIRVVELASRAHAMRSETVHDILIQMPHNPGTIRSGFANRKSREMEQLEKCANDLKEATWRLRGVWIIAPQWVGGPIEEWETVESLTSWTRVAMGYIEDDPNMVRGKPGKTPQPPGGFRVSAA